MSVSPDILNLLIIQGNFTIFLTRLCVGLAALPRSRPPISRWGKPTRFEFVVDARTAQVLDLDLPPTVLARADEVIR